MKVFLATLVVIAAHGAVKGAAKLRGVVAFRRLEAANETFTGTLGLQGGAGPFAKVKDDNPDRWQQLVVDEMKDYGTSDVPDTFLWTADQEFPLLHSKLDYDMCIQAGYGGTVQHGTKLRLNLCDKDNEFQKWDTYIHGSMKLLDDKYKDYCVASRGTHYDFGEDPMIMVSCDRLGEECGRGCFSFD